MTTFKRLVHEGFLAIPQTFREKIKNVAIVIEDEPSGELRREEGLSPGETLLGHYTGIPLTERGSDYGVGPTLPDRIMLFRRPIEEAASGNPEDIRTIVSDTIWHECAHYFGMDEREVLEREEEKSRVIREYRGR